MRMRLRINQDGLARVGAILCGTFALFQLFSFCISVFVYKDTSFNNILSRAIDVIFYIYICSYFMKAKSNFYYSYIAILCLLISTYVLPLIFSIIQLLASTIVTGGLNFIIPSISLIAGVVYFILMVMERKKNNPKYITALIVVGSILLVLGVISAVFVFYSGIITIIQNASLYSEIFDLIMKDLIAIISMISSIVSIGFALIYFMYPIILRKIY